jgi:hypothetical protein
MTASSPMNAATRVGDCRENYEQADQWLAPVPFSRLPGETNYLVGVVTSALDQYGIYSGDLLAVAAVEPQPGGIVLGVAGPDPGQLGGPILGRWQPHPRPSLGGRVHPLVNAPSLARYEWLVLVSVAGVFYRSGALAEYRSAADLRPHACPCCTCLPAVQKDQPHGFILNLSEAPEVSQPRPGRIPKSKPGRKPRFGSEMEFWAEAETALRALATPLKGVFSIGRLARRLTVSRSMMSEYLRRRPELRKRCELFVRDHYLKHSLELHTALRQISAPSAGRLLRE